MDSWSATSALFLAGFITSAAFRHFDSECYTANGQDYRGFQNQTSLHGGKPCLFWNETFQHPYNTLKYPNGEGGLGSHNYCRNPDGDVQPWCYIADHEDVSYWKYCDIPSCQMPGNLGCFKDTGHPPTLPGVHEISNKLTIQTCINFCRSQKYSLAGMESGYACFCGNEADLQDHVESSSMECNHVCFGDHTQPCGGDGWIIVFDVRVGACGGNYTSPAGVIYSPDFPDKYAASRVCYWTIQVPGSYAILFNFTFFDISDQTDMVELLDGYTREVVARFDWRSPPRGLVNITGDFVILYFFSDRTNQAHGFALLYQALRRQDARTTIPRGSDEKEHKDASSTLGPQLSSSVTEGSNSTANGRTSHILYVITSSPGKPEHNMPGQWAGRGETTGHSAMWTIYALAALLILTVVAMVAKLLLHVTVKTPNIPTVSGSDSCSQSTVSSEPWIILYRPSTISLFKKKLKNHHGDLSPLVGH
ncbi:kremen protein 1 isoform X1 [Poecilia latipinna]|uniref:Kringle-containing protein marking the eye and the nose n=2 Tax=Poecilia TaxID=8080 RepID=A0A087Y8V4_POEFO|nr:PREDICTED: kremen protein 1 isoform X1 [Poecilia mexicana]XP_014876486.1 PREDICTED: kremen protein 1 isoform X1 [Poecilia latipinna]